MKGRSKSESEYKSNVILLSILFIVVLWYLVLVISPKIRNLLPWPHQVGKAIIHLLFDSSFRKDLLNTFLRAFLGFVLASVLAALTGFFINRVHIARVLLIFPLEFVRSLPSVVLLSLILIFVYPGEVMRIMLVFIPVFLVMTLSFVYGLDRGSILRKDVARKFGLDEKDIFIKIELKEAFPEIVTGMRISVSIALILTIVVEMFFPSGGGLGAFIESSRMNVNKAPELWGTIVILGSLGFGLNRLFIWIDNRYCHWKGK